MDISEFLKGPRVAAAVQAKAKEVQAYWQSIAPIFEAGAPREHRQVPSRGSAGDYKNSIKVRDISDENGARARVSDSDWKAEFIEFGKGVHFPPQAPLAKTKARFR